MKKSIWISEYGIISEIRMAGWSEYVLVNNPGSIDAIFFKICKLNMTDEKKVYEKRISREAPFLECRAWHMLLMREIGKKKYKDAGEVYEKDHATCMNAVRKIKRWVKYDRFFFEKYAEIIAEVRVIEPFAFIEKSGRVG